MKKIPLALVCLLFIYCDSDRGQGPLSPAVDNNTGGTISFAHETSSRLHLDISLALREPSGRTGTAALLAAARDDSTSDSTRLYMDVEVTNVTPKTFLLPAEADTLTIIARVTFVDYPHKKTFNRGRLRLVVGQTHTGFETTDYFDTVFYRDTTLVARLPMSRIDTFHVADNVAVYGTELAEDRYIVARLVRCLSPGQDPPHDNPALVGYVKDSDLKRNRLYVNEATVVIADTTRIESAGGQQISLDGLRSGINELTISTMAWALTEEGYIMANGWEFMHFDMIVARPPGSSGNSDVILPVSPD
ncbi:MAG: hypothetical protein U9P14_01555 [Gemmatimonadota bacterium]|nr:hypothetical protein [Gemmatimonadota bacterium]